MLRRTYASVMLEAGQSMSSHHARRVPALKLGPPRPTRAVRNDLGNEGPVSAELVRLYADYLHGEYGDLDSDYVFVNP
ncbi:hypothetical protein [Streptomyces olivaceiscleroticus]|uniref:Uncharacterized protein n=1 Tax=Streptomyces olivaceiscleroticus TaxID=68245 RepID=A0ABP3J4W5_9ACTN